MDDGTSIQQLAKIFNAKNWFAKDKEEAIFDTFCELLRAMTPEERVLMIELTQRYLWITGREYEDEVIVALASVPDPILKEASKMFVFPIVKPGDEGRIKSGISLAYDVKSMITTLNHYRHLKPISIESFNGFKAAPGTKEKELLFLIDDFIGTGDTFFQCLKEISSHMTIDYERLIVIAISIQKETYYKLIGQGIKVFVKHQIERGISDFNSPDVSKQKILLMKLIEESIPGAKSLSLGYEGSEATITLKRTPDNTFPIFWKRMRRNGRYLDAPFLRVD